MSNWRQALRRKLLLVSSALLSMIFLELGCFFLSFFVPKDYYYTPPTREQFYQFLSRMESSPRAHPTLGWLPPAEAISADGYRLSPSGARYSRSCVSAYGDSFIYGEDVSAEAAWGNKLADLLGCRVDNFGVSGYGTDQALLRFRENRADKSDLVILGYLSENIVRNINQDRALIYGDGIVLKPRFVLRDGHLSLIPTPKLTWSDYKGYVRSIGRYLHEEWFIPNVRPSSKRTLAFPYIINLPYSMTYTRVIYGILSIPFNVKPWFYEFYDDRHPSSAVQLTLAIIMDFHKEARLRGKKPLVLVIPTSRDIYYFAKRGEWTYVNLIRDLSNKGVPYINAGDYIVRFLGKDKLLNKDYLCSFFCTNKDTMSGHYTEMGNLILAEIARDVLCILQRDNASDPSWVRFSCPPI